MKNINLYNNELKACAIHMEDIDKEKIKDNKKYQDNEEKIIKEWNKFKKYEEKFYKKLYKLTKTKNKILSTI
jgi:hypothetical protein